ncbi:MAG: hypothetical protein ACRD15_03760 [Vicinamibacterales bacterium]
MSRARSARMGAAGTGLMALLIYCATTGGSLATTDAVVTYEVTRNLMQDGSVALSDGRMEMPELRGPDGRYFAPFGIGQSLYNIPFYLAGALVAQVSGAQFGSSDTVTKAAVCVGSAFAAAGCVWLTCLFATRVSGSVTAGRTAALSLALGSALWPYSKFGFSAPLAALCLTGGVYGAWLGTVEARQTPSLWGGALLGAALLTRHEMVLAAVATLAWIRWVSPRETALRQVAAAAAGPAVALAVWLLYNGVRFGNPLFSGHEPQFDVTGLFGLLLAPGGSVFLYSPVAVPGIAALAWVWRHDRRTASLLTSVITILFLFYAALEDWLGTRSYGPRYLVPLLPLLCVPLAGVLSSAGADRWRSPMLAATIAGAFVQIPGVLVDPGKVNVALGRPGPVTASERRYDWQVSALVLNTRAAAERVPANVQYLLGTEEPPEVPKSSGPGSFSQGLAFSLDFWWLYLFYLRVLGAAAALAIPATLLAAAGGLAWQARRADS